MRDSLNNRQVTPVAIVDDDYLFRSLARKYVSRLAGFSIVFEAADGGECIKKMEAAAVLPAIIILDIAMYPMGGFKAIKILKAKCPQVKILVLSVHCRDYCLHYMLHNRANGFLSKAAMPGLPAAMVCLADNEIYYSELVTPDLYDKIKKGEIQIPEMTGMEMEIANYLNTDMVHKEIADKLNIGIRTLEKHLEHLYKKFELHSRNAFLSFAIKNEMLSP